ncbi:hypothetical protein FOL47_011300 [Perkinsus chesapeaki]|uniref:Integrase catalytic domain-containing protein n=1 Tax=Perkinsus chesapeaki TaxID=330153 RepID=A0A7J6KYP7_PERCH|nr:hypothetical protein FOL47_011300 [Perkinsus chesapeaki]
MCGTLCANALVNDETTWRGIRLRDIAELSGQKKEQADKLFAVHPDGNIYFVDTNGEHRLYVPHEASLDGISTLRTKLLLKAHWPHCPLQAMKNRLREQCWWPKMRRDINNFYQNCFSCRRELLRVVPLGGQRSRQLSNRFETLIVDFCGPFSGVTIGGLSSPSIIILIDSFTTWLELSLVSGPTAREAARSVLDWSLRFGCPRHLVSDQGQAFTAELTTILNKALSIDSVLSGGYHPNPQGQAENPRAYGDEDITPEDLVYGGRSRDAVQSLLEFSSTGSHPPSDATSYLTALQQEISALHAAWRTTLAEGRALNLSNNYRHEPSISPGDRVFRVIVDGLGKRRVLGPYFVLAPLDSQHSMANLSSRGRPLPHPVPVWQLFKAPSDDIIHTYGSLGIPELADLISTPCEDLAVGDLICFRNPDDDTEGVVSIDIGRVYHNHPLEKKGCP